jgi:hypothetical protein
MWDETRSAQSANAWTASPAPPLAFEMRVHKNFTANHFSANRHRIFHTVDAD